MTKFSFRLQKVLEYRELLEENAKDAFLEARANRLLAESECEHFQVRRKSTTAAVVSSIEDHKAIERMMIRIDEEERQQRIVIQILTEEEEAKKAEWIEKRKEHETLKNLQNKELENWLYEEKRFEQAQSDEWVVNRRTK